MMNIAIVICVTIVVLYGMSLVAEYLKIKK